MSGIGKVTRSAILIGSEEAHSSPQVLKFFNCCKQRGNFSEETISLMSGRVFLFPVDRRMNTQKAFLWFINTFVQPTEEVVILHVIKPVDEVVEELGYSVFSSYPAPTRGLVMDNRIANAKKICSTYLEFAHRGGFSGVGGSISTYGRIEEAIIRSAIVNRATTIVIPTRGLGRWRLFWANSISEYVSKHSTIPLILIPPHKEPRRESQL